MARRTPELADLIDLEHVLRADRERPLEVLRAREARIAAELGVDAASPGAGGRELVLAWLDRVRASGEPAPGRAASRALSAVAAALTLIGLALGAGGVASWLAAVDARPVNTIHLWTALVGVQLGLLALWLPSLLPESWIARVAPLRAARALLSALASAGPALVGGLLARVTDRRIDTAPLRRLEALYGPLRFWTLARLTQGFALAFNLGAAVALAGLPYVDDPAFGWRSRLLSPAQLELAQRVVAAPWRAAWPAAVLDREQIVATRYSRMEPRFGDTLSPAARRVWGAWWPFLLASLLFYGVLPRLGLWLLARFRFARELRSVPLDHADVERLRARLLRPSVDARADAPDPDVGPGSAARGSGPALPHGPARVLVWSGVDLDADALRRRLAVEGIEARDIRQVGGPDPAQDRAALDALRAVPDDTPVLLVVEGWEPPSADYADLVGALRDALGPAHALVVALVHPRGWVEPRLLAQWRERLGQLADPRLRVEALGGEERA